jgi:predicted secreted hydrolase
MSLAGTLTDHGEQISVSGQAWMDHQWGNFISILGSGWDWYSIQLGNNTEYMLYVIRDRFHHPISTFGTYVASDGSATQIESSDIATRALSTWVSPHTGGVYPSGWEVRITGAGRQISLTLMPQLLDQELLTTESTGNVYWEGAVRISGSLDSHPISGVGYVELNGYVNIPMASQNPLLP